MRGKEKKKEDGEEEGGRCNTFQILRRRAVAAATWIRGAANMLRLRRRAAHMPSFTLASHTSNVRKIYVYIFFFPSGNTVPPGGHPGSRLLPSIIQRAGTRPEAAGLLAASQETCRSALTLTLTLLFFLVFFNFSSTSFLANCT